MSKGALKASMPLAAAQTLLVAAIEREPCEQSILTITLIFPQVLRMSR